MRTAALALGALLLAGCGHNAPTLRVQVYEDGSGVQYVHGQQVRTFPEGTFVWPQR